MIKRDINKPGIFIGSSGKELAVAKRISELLEPVADCHVWDESFPIGVHPYDHLLRTVASYDYGIFLATADDPIFSKGVESVAPRDNVIFELGLFAGALGKNRTIMIFDETAKEMSDLYGITFPHIKGKTDAGRDDSIVKCCEAIRNHIESRKNVFELGLVPSTVIAYGYFHNFIEKVTRLLREDIHKGKVFELVSGQKLTFKEVKIVIHIPDDLDEDMFNKTSNLRMKEGWRKFKVPPGSERDYDFHINLNSATDGVLEVHDVPLTFNALHEAVNDYVQKAHIGKDEREQFLEQKVLRDFKRTLDYLIESNSMTKGYVFTEVVSLSRNVQN